MFRDVFLSHLCPLITNKDEISIDEASLKTVKLPTDTEHIQKIF